jgi:hypothetical protein
MTSTWPTDCKLKLLELLQQHHIRRVQKRFETLLKTMSIAKLLKALGSCMRRSQKLRGSHIGARRTCSR